MAERYKRKPEKPGEIEKLYAAHKIDLNLNSFLSPQ
jgi:hypothetical protein